MKKDNNLWLPEGTRPTDLTDTLSEKQIAALYRETPRYENFEETVTRRRVLEHQPTLTDDELAELRVLFDLHWLHMCNDQSPGPGEPRFGFVVERLGKEITESLEPSPERDALAAQILALLTP